MKTTKRNDLLKIIAMVTMLIDHIGVLLLPEVRLLRTIGRIAFPIFGYQLALGYSKTSDRKRYRKRLLFFGLISQIPYMYLNFELEPGYFHFNVILYFWCITFILSVIDIIKESFKEDSKNILKGSLFIGLLVILVFLPEFLHFQWNDFYISYGTYGILMILVFYNFRENPSLVIVGYLVVTVISTTMTGVYYYNLNSQIGYFKSFGKLSEIWKIMIDYKDGLRKLEGYFFQARSFMAVIVIMGLSYFNPKIKLNKYIGYFFYPVHITILIILHILIY